MKKCDILFLSDQDGPDLTDLKRELHCVVLNEAMGNVMADARRRKVHYYCVSEDQEENLTAALSLMSRLEKEERTVQRNNHVFL